MWLISWKDGDGGVLTWVRSTTGSPSAGEAMMYRQASTNSKVHIAKAGNKIQEIPLQPGSEAKSFSPYLVSNHRFFCCCFVLGMGMGCRLPDAQEELFKNYTTGRLQAPSSKCED